MHTHQIIGRGVMKMTGSVAEWSKALVLGTSLSGRGFESHRCQTFFSLLLQWAYSRDGELGKMMQNTDGDEGDRTPGISNANRALYH